MNKLGGALSAVLPELLGSAGWWGYGGWGMIAAELLPTSAYSLPFRWNGKVDVMADKKFSKKRLADYVEKLAAGFTVLGFGGGWVSAQVSASEAVLVVAGGVILALIACIMD